MLLSPVLIFVFGCQSGAAAVVQILHEPEEGQFIEEDLWNLHEQVLPAILQSTADKFTERVLEEKQRANRQTGNFSCDPTALVQANLEQGWHRSYLQYASQLSVEKTDKLFALVVLLGESEDHAPDRSQELDGAHLVHVLLWEERRTVTSHFSLQ